MGGGMPSTEQLDAQLAYMSLPVARRVLSANLSRLLELRHDQKIKARQLEAAELALSDKDAAVAAAQAAARQAAADAERRLEHAHARHVRELIEQQRVVQTLQAQLQHAKAPSRASQHDQPPPPAGAPTGADADRSAAEATGRDGEVVTSALTPSRSESRSADERTPDSVASSVARSPSQQTLEVLGKDNFYYKQANRELRRKLRDAAAAADTQQLELEAARERAAAERQLHATLLAELQAERDALANLKAYLAAHPGATPTRITKSALKEIGRDWTVSS
jgi:hypothetical protein